MSIITKEEIQVKIDFIREYPELFDDRLHHEISNLLDRLEQELLSAPSIQDLEEQAFNAGRSGRTIADDEIINESINNLFEFESFNDYKTKQQ